MSRKILWILTIALSLTVTGIIVLQIRWIKNAVNLNDKQFQQLVNSTLNDVSTQIEHYYTSMTLHAEIEDQDPTTSSVEWNITVEDGETPVIVFDESDVSEHKHLLREEVLSDSVVELISDTLIIIRAQDHNTVDTLKIAHFQEEMELKKIQEEIKQQEVIIKKVMKNMLLQNQTFEERIDQQSFEKILHENFKNRAIDLPFEYSVIRDKEGEIYRSDLFSKNTDCYYYRLGLMNGDVLEKDTYLYLYFPGQRALARSSLGFLGISTIILTMIMIVLFSFALYVIFKQKKLSDVKNDFVNNMTHELKTPISTISLASQMLNDTSIPAERKNMTHISNIIQTESKRLGYQVERVLQMAVLDQGHLVLKHDEVSMNEIVSNVVQNFKLQVESLQGKLELFDESNFDLIRGDRVHLMNVLTNLLDNAVKYSKDAPDINIRLFNTGDFYAFSVKDHGIGISKENQKKVFERFYRVSTGNVHDVKGFGLGLSYVKLIVEQHNGQISMSSEPGKGTIFEIKLPLYKESH